MEPLFCVDRAKGGRAGCKGCKDKCLNGELRMGKVVPSPYSDEQKMKSWYHVDCLMNALLKQRPATKRIETVHDIGNWENISKEDQEFILDKINETEKLYFDKHSGKIKLNVLTNDLTKPKPKDVSNKAEDADDQEDDEDETKSVHQDGMFSEFVRLCADISKEDSYLGKTSIVNNFFTKGTDKKGFKGNVTMWCSMLLPQAIKRVYNLKSKQLVKLFSRILHADHDDMLTDLENGDVAKTVETFFAKSKSCKSAAESTLTLDEVNEFLEKLTTLTKEDEQVYHFKTIIKRCTESDLRMILRLIKGDLRINAGPKHILEGIHPDAYKAFQTSRDINLVMSRVLPGSSTVQNKQSPQKTVQAKIALMTPVLPMLAEACKSVEMAMKKCPNGMFSEIKYDGERVQVHKQGKEFKYFSRALKPVMPHKVNHFKDYIPQAFARGEDLILDAEVLLVDTDTDKPLPFGTLGAHKHSEFKNAQVCLFVFDCIYYNGEVLLDVPVRKRRKILEDNMVEVKNHVMFSEQELIRKPSDLADMISKVIQQGLEGLILKDLESIYRPGKRHWLKVKKDYLFGGAMADTADLVVLGAWFGTGRKGGMMSVFLMGCYDEDNRRWVTVTKVHGGHDDKTLEKLQETLGVTMYKISKDSARVPDWLHCTNTMVPDFVAKDPKKQPVWEITGTEFSKAKVHTADGISVRFPRVTRIRDDKDWKTATNLKELKTMFKNSKESTDVSLLTKLAATARGDEDQFSGVKTSPGKNTTDKKIDSYFSKNVKRASDDSDTDEKPVPKKKIKVESPEIENVTKDLQLLPKKPLPDTFKGHKLGFYPDFISFSEPDRNLVERHWAAYGGTVVKSLQDHNVEYVLHKKDQVVSTDLKVIKKRWPNKVSHISKQWLLKCIATKKLCDPRPYCVSLRPTTV